MTATPSCPDTPPPAPLGQAIPDPSGREPMCDEPTFAAILEHVVPESFIRAAADNEVLQIVFWTVLFGVALSQLQGRPKELMLGVIEALAEVGIMPQIYHIQPG